MADKPNAKKTDDPKAKNRKKRIVAAVSAAACGLCLVGLFFLNTDELTFSFNFPSKETEQLYYTGNGKHRISLYDPDWESDIFENRRWLELNRYITYVEGGMAITLVDGDYAAYGEPVAFFGEYTDALMHGDAERLNSFYSEEYFETHDRYERITMQKLYNIKVEYLSRSEIKLNGGTATKYIYKLTYMIMENDGTFRDDLLSDGERPQFYTLIDDGSGIKITDVSYSYKVD